MCKIRVVLFEIKTPWWDYLNYSSFRTIWAQVTYEAPITTYTTFFRCLRKRTETQTADKEGRPSDIQMRSTLTKGQLTGKSPVGVCG